MIKPRVRTGLAVALAVLVLDQLTKWWALESLLNPPRVVEVLPVFNLVLAWNTGISFGMFANGAHWGSWVLVAVAGMIVIWLLRWLFRAESGLTALCIGLIVGGAIGNVIDRLRFGAVVDFLDFHAGSYHWPAFNAADTAIVVGAALLVAEALFWTQESPKQDGGEPVE